MQARGSVEFAAFVYPTAGIMNNADDAVSSAWTIATFGQLLFVYAYAA
jgi:hypothetical protein